MRRHVQSITVGLCVSLLLHGAVFYTAVGQYMRDLSHVSFGPLLVRGQAAARVSVFDSPDRFGDDRGQGTASQAEAGDQPLIAPDGDTIQALLSRDPQGPPGRPGPPSRSQDADAKPAAPGQSNSAQSNLAQSDSNQANSVQSAPSAAAASVMTPALADTAAPAPRSQSPSIPIPAPEPLVNPSPALPDLVGTTQSPAIKPADGKAAPTTVAIVLPHDPSPASATPVAPRPPSPPQQPPQQSPPAPKSSPPAASNPPAPTAPPAGGGGGSPVPPSDSDSDPFNNSIDAVVRPGGIDAVRGRKFKAQRVDLTLAAQADLMAASDDVRVQMAVWIDPSGNVTDVKVIGSSGYGDIDLPCEQAMRLWWIEPTRDKSGKAVPDVITITIHFQ